MRKLFLLITFLMPTLVQAAIETRSVEYRQGNTRLVGYLAFPKDVATTWHSGRTRVDGAERLRQASCRPAG